MIEDTHKNNIPRSRRNRDVNNIFLSYKTDYSCNSSNFLPKKSNKSTETFDRIYKGLNMVVQIFLKRCSAELSEEREDQLAGELGFLLDAFACLELDAAPSEQSDRDKELLPIGLSVLREQTDLFYGISLELFEEKKYAEASDVLFLLTTLDPTSPTYWLSLGIAEQKESNYREALEAYTVASLLELDDPLPYAYSAQCHLMRNDRVQATTQSATALKLAKKSDEHATIQKQLIHFRELRLGL